RALAGEPQGFPIPALNVQRLGFGGNGRGGPGGSLHASTSAEFAGSSAEPIAKGGIKGFESASDSFLPPLKDLKVSAAQTPSKWLSETVMVSGSAVRGDGAPSRRASQWCMPTPGLNAGRQGKVEVGFCDPSSLGTCVNGAPPPSSSTAGFPALLGSGLLDCLCPGRWHRQCTAAEAGERTPETGTAPASFGTHRSLPGPPAGTGADGVHVPIGGGPGCTLVQGQPQGHRERLGASDA